MLGDGGRSYVIGFGSNSPRRPHHAASTCACTGCCDWDTYNADADNCQTLTGALVGGPGSNDDYDDGNRLIVLAISQPSASHHSPSLLNPNNASDRTNYYNNEVATDYNAAFQSAIASLELKYGTGTYSNSDAEKVCSSTPMCDGNQMYNYFGEGWPTCNFWVSLQIAFLDNTHLKKDALPSQPTAPPRRPVPTLRGYPSWALSCCCP
jgi:hypothetical protein